MAHDDELASRDDGSAAHRSRPEDDATDYRDEDVRSTIAPGRWVRRAVLVLVVLIAGYFALKISAAFFPRWWAQRVADQVQGGFVAGTTWGLFYGFVFTALPLLLLFQIRRRFFSWTWRGVVAVVAVVLAAPNWLTLAVVVGNSKAAHAGERIMDVDAPNFRVATLIGAVVGALLAIAIRGAGMRMKQRRHQVERLKGERDELRSRRSSEDG